MNKLALGTAQFGLNYGVSNKDGRTKIPDVEKILGFAKNQNIDLIDTAISYGNSEKIIGKLGISDFRFVTKLPSLPNRYVDIESWVERYVESSLNHLGIESLYGLLIHKSENFLNASGKKLIEVLNRMKQYGLVKKIGVSIYDPSEFEKIFGLTRIDIIQAPLNIMDRRLIKSGWLSRLHSEEIEIHTRSVFLQGLLLMNRKNIPNYFFKWSNIFDQWEFELKKNNLNALDVCLSYPLSIPQVDRVIVGVENINQLKEIINKSNIPKSQLDTSFMISNEEMLINPSNWKI